MKGYLKLRLQKPKVKYVLIGFGLGRAKKHLVFVRGYTDESCIFQVGCTDRNLVCTKAENI